MPDQPQPDANGDTNKPSPPFIGFAAGTCAEPNSGRICCQTNGEWFLACWRAVCRSVEGAAISRGCPVGAFPVTIPSPVTNSRDANRRRRP
jgi:hypothetical protein